MNTELYALSKWLKSLNNIPKRIVRKETLLDIAGIEHLENHWSYIYLYFFNAKASHGLSRLFVDTLQELICKKTNKPELSLATFSVLREETVPDEKGNMKRIDLLLQNENEAIIIENKVYASLYNRLDLYWNKPNVPEKNKRGIVLSLWHTTPSHPGFINITHEEFAKAIEKNLPSYFMSAQPKGLMLLQDFIQNIYNLTHSMNREEILFYFNEENRQKINRLAEIRKSVIRHIWKAIENKDLLKPRFGEYKMKLSVKTKNNEDYVYYTFDAMPEKVMLTLCYDTLWKYDQKGCRIRMFLELQGDMIKFVDNNEQELKNIGVEPQNYYKCNSYWHFRGTEIPYTPDELSEENVIVSKITDAIKNSLFYDDGMKIISLWKEKHN